MKKTYSIQIETWSSVDDLGNRFRFNDYSITEQEIQGYTAALGEAIRLKRKAGERSCIIVRKPDGRGREVTARRLTGRSY